MERPPLVCRNLGFLLVAFAVFVLVLSAAASLLLDGVMLDVVALALLLVGASVRAGSATARRWALGLMGYYVFVALAVFVVAVASPAALEVVGRPLRPGELALVLPPVGLMGLWALANFLLLWANESAFVPPPRQELDG